MPERSKVIEVACLCGVVLFKYKKIGKGRLVRCYLPRILEDRVGVPAGIALGRDVACPACASRIGTVIGIKGMRAIKLNQGQIKPFRLD